ncbi:MAG: dehydrogenase [Acidobacteria bacterium]|nr:MAG: dehydrogenase [Acidobacteriota bacterium]
MKARRTALITGASSGIGEAFADVFASEGFDLVLTARREERLRAVKARLEERDGVHAELIVADLERPDAAARICAELEARGLKIDALVNNAGYGVPGSFLSSSWDVHSRFLQIMVAAVAELTYRLLPGMVERQYGRIINVASLAGLVPAPAGHTLYAAAKAFLIKFSESLSHEVRQNNVLVTALCPGFTFSEFHDVTGTRAMMDRMPGWMWMSAAAVARQGYDAVMQGDAVVVTGRLNSTIATLVRILPQRLVVGLGRRIGREYRKA